MYATEKQTLPISVYFTAEFENVPEPVVGLPKAAWVCHLVSDPQMLMPFTAGRPVRNAAASSLGR